ncbi:MAG: hypothetical protein RLZZ127_513 [Planctomycetota bacterium]|jgi:hypothetical protein
MRPSPMAIHQADHKFPMPKDYCTENINHYFKPRTFKAALPQT